MNKDNMLKYVFRSWYCIVLFAAWILILFSDRSFIDNPTGWLTSFIGWGILAGIPASILLLTEIKVLSDEISRYWLIPSGICAAFWVWLASDLLGVVHGICQFDIWQRERLFFWNQFLTGYQDNLASAAERMMSPGMTGDIQQCIGFILLPYRTFARIGLYSGSILLILSALLIVVISWNKNAVRFSCGGMLTGLLLFGFGFFNAGFAGMTQQNLDTIARIQQSAMKKMQTICPAVPSEQVRKLIETYAGKKTFGEPYETLLKKIEEKND